MIELTIICDKCGAKQTVQVHDETDLANADVLDRYKFIKGVGVLCPECQAKKRKDPES